MRSSTLATLVPASASRPAVVAGILRSTIACVFCQRPQQGSAYAICPDCFSANPGLTSHPLYQRFLRRASFESFPRHYNIVQMWRALRAANQSERAFALAQWVRRRTYIWQAPHVPTPRDWAVSKALAKRFSCETRALDAYWSFFGDQREPGTSSGRDRGGNALEVSDYPGETLAERYDLDADEAIRALKYGTAGSDEALEIASTAASIVRDALYRAPRLNRALHEARVREFLQRKGCTDTLDSERPRRHRVFVGVKHSSGTYSYWIPRRENRLVGSSRGFAQQSFS